MDTPRAAAKGRRAQSRLPTPARPRWNPGRSSLREDYPLRERSRLSHRHSRDKLATSMLQRPEPWPTGRRFP